LSVFLIFVVIALSALLCSPGMPQNSPITVTAEVDPPDALVGDSVTYSVTISGANLPDTISPDVPGLNEQGLQVLTNRQNRTMMSGSSFTIIINGRTVNQDKNAQEQVVIEYVLRATRPGSYRLGPASVDIGGNNYKSKEVTLNVTTEPVAPQGIRARGEVFLHTAVSPKRVYIGQQVTVKYYLYIRGGSDITQLINIDLPQMDGFIKNDMEKPSQFRPVNRNIGGQYYNEVFLGRQVAFPISAGNRTIGVMKVAYVQNVKGRVHPIFGAQYYQQKGEVSSEPVAVEALPLPESGKPANFSGAVGRFQIQAEVDRREARVGESVSLTVLLSGAGNLQSASEPSMNIPNSFQSYPPEKEDQHNMVGDEVQSSRKLKLILVPQQAGDFTIGPVTFSYFDPVTGAYQDASAQPITIRVNPGASGPTVSSINLPESEEIRLLSRDIRYIKPDVAYLRNDLRPFYARPWYWALHALPLLTLVGAVLLRRRQDRLRMDVSYARRVRARATAGKKLARASQLLKDEDISTFYLLLSEALLGFIADHLDLKAAGLTSDDISSRMTGAGVPTTLVQQLVAMLKRCDAARYAPSTLSQDMRHLDLEEARRLIDELGKVFEKGKRQ